MAKFQPTAQLGYSDDFYTPSSLNLDKYSIKEIRAEYSRLRSIARKRQQRIQKTEFYRGQDYLSLEFPKLKDIKTPAQLGSELSRVAKFVTTETTTVTGQQKIRAKTLTSLHEKGYTFINEKNYAEFMEFMDYLKSYAQRFIYDSEQVIEEYFGKYTDQYNADQLKEKFDEWVQDNPFVIKKAKTRK